MSQEILLIAVFAVAVSTAALWLWWVRRRGWFDHPNQRSSHVIPTPSSGGVAILAGFSLHVALQTQSWSEPFLWLALGAALLLALTGLADDFFRLPIKPRLVLQLVAMMAMWPLLSRLPAWELVGGISLAGPLLVLLLSFAVWWFVNLYNFMDGIDGLAAMEALFFCAALAVMPVETGHTDVLAVALSLAAAVVGFWTFNLAPARLFMGDVGSYFLGCMLPILGCRLVLESQLGYWSLLILLGTFVSDSTTTLLGRLWSGSVWYHPHRSHAYQLLALHWRSHGKVVVVYLTINVLWLLPLAWLAERYPEQGFWLTMVAWLPLVVAVHGIRRRWAASS